MAKSERKPKPAAKAVTKKRQKVSPPTPPPTLEPKIYSDAQAESAFTNLPFRLDETLAVVRYTGRKRAYIHYGRAGDGTAFWYLIRSDGPRLLKVYPSPAAESCFAEMLAMMEGWRSSVNPDPMSPSYCDICPDEETILQTVRLKYLNSEE